MKHLAKSMVLVGAMVAASSAAASWVDDICPFIGVDYKQTWMKGKGFWNSRFAKSYPGATLYIGTKFNECWGLELGYTWSARKTRTTHLDRRFFGPYDNNVVGYGYGYGNRNHVRTTARFNSVHLDLNGYLPLDNCWELIGSIGVASMKPKVHVDFRNNNRFFVNNNARFAESVRGKSKAVWRLGVGAQYLFTECVGLRAMLRWENTSSLRVHYDRHHGRRFNGTYANNYNYRGRGFDFTRKAFKDAVSLAVGLFVKF